MTFMRGAQTLTVSPVMLPGNMCDERLWGGLGEPFGAAGGLALGEMHHADLGLDDTIAGMAARTLANVVGPVLPIGFSMGAIVAVEMWLQAPDRVTGLVLLGYNASSDLPERAVHRPAQQKEVLLGGLERVLVEELKPHYLAARNRGNASLLALLRDMGVGLGPEVFVRQSEALRRRADRRALLSHITVPVLIGCGLEDTLCPPSWHTEWASLVPRAELFTIAGTGHMLPLEAPDALAIRLRHWLHESEFA